MTETTPEMIDTPDSEVYQRQSALRTFQVTCADGSAVIVFAHKHENTNPSGHLNFITMHALGWSIISRSFHSAVWRELVELFDPKAIESAINRSSEDIH